MNPDKVYLAEHTVGYIEANPEEHHQASWRCSTGMCFAGHVANFSGMEWLVPASKMAVDNRAALYMVQDLLITTSDAPGAVTLPHYLGHYGAMTRAVIGDNLREIRPDLNLNTVYVINAAEYATLELGLTPDEADILFSGGNTVKDLKTGVKILADGKTLDRDENGHIVEFT